MIIVNLKFKNKRLPLILYLRFRRTFYEQKFTYIKEIYSFNMHRGK